MDKIRLVVILAVVVLAIISLLFVVDVQDNFRMLLGAEQGMIRQLSERLSRIEQELGIDPIAERLGADIAG